MIQTKIAQILSPTRVVLAAGGEQGMQVGMEFIIYELSDSILDPETKEPLGQLELHKGRVRVVHVQERMATATTLPRRAYKPSMSEIIDALGPFRKRGWVDEYEELPIDQTAAIAVKTDLTVRVGGLGTKCRMTEKQGGCLYISRSQRRLMLRANGNGAVLSGEQPVPVVWLGPVRSLPARRLLLALDAVQVLDGAQEHAPRPRRPATTSTSR